ncbi:MAG: hypothetical protein AAF969_00175 [Bacteroidota bacterium]
MDNYQNILDKLKGFINKYYAKQLIKGTLLFLALGLLFWLGTLSVEYFFWLSKGWRLFLLWAFVGVVLALLVSFIVIPCVYLFGLKNGISNKEASRHIAKHFPDVSDRLLNLLELSESNSKSELLLASIEQRSKDLGNVPFGEAVDFKEGFKYIKYLIVPASIVLLVWLSGEITSFFGSQKRLVNYDVIYEKPAPFQFIVQNDSLVALESEALKLIVSTIGDYRPDNAFLVVEGEQVVMLQEEGMFTYTFDNFVGEKNFYLTANNWDSPEYTVRRLETPKILDFRMKLDYPGYLGMKDEVVSGTGNAVVPEGTGITWVVKGDGIDVVTMIAGDSLFSFEKADGSFINGHRMFKNLDYSIGTSNENVQNFERLGYSIEVIPDEHPSIEVTSAVDSLNLNQLYFEGLASDDHGVRDIRVVAYPGDSENGMKRITLIRPNEGVHKFYYTFPSGLELEDGLDYTIFFEVVDNDGLRGGKLTKSELFRTKKYGHNELKNNELQNNQEMLNKMDRSLEQYEEQSKELERINRSGKEEKNTSFQRNQEIKDFLRRQDAQEELMEKFAKQLKESIEKDELDSKEKRLLRERLERQELEAKRNQKLLEELNKLADQIEKEDLKKKLEELSKKQSSSARNLEQLLELTKRYYVTEKMRQLGKELEEMSEKQLELSESNENTTSNSEEQEKLNEDFDKLTKELEELRMDNEKLKKPLELGVQAKDEDGIKKDQQDALDKLNEQHNEESRDKEQEGNPSKNTASQKQKSAAQRMMQMAEKMQQASSGGGGSTVTEDAEMLRQILDNLVTFSFKQEGLFEKVEGADVSVSQFSGTVREQKELRRLFEHVDDSLFALSLRRVELSEFVNEQITEVYYNIDKSLESIAENQIFQGASHQQYVISATNALAEFLADILDNMQQSMKPGQGGGQSGQDFQLPDIIEGQQGIQEKMQGSGQGKKGSEGESEKGQQGANGEGNSKEDGLGEGEEDSGKNDRRSQGKEGSGEGFGNEEMELSEIYEIYKEQQQIRQELERQLEDMIESSDRDLAKKLIRQMEDFENDLLENGVTQRTQNKVNNIQHELLKLKGATLEQGKKKERQGDTNENDFSNPILTRPDLLKGKENNIEILNRQALPLRQNYEKKVKVYFKND